MRGKRVLAGLLAGVMTIVPIQVRAEEVAYDIYTFTDMNNLTVSIPASLPLTYSGGVFSGKGDVTVSGTNTSTTEYSVEIAVDSVNIDYTNQSDSSAVASGTVSFGTNGVESWTKDEVASSTGKDISVEVADFPEVEGVYSSVINYTIEVDETLKNDTYFTKTVNDSTMTCEITGLTDAGKEWVKTAVTTSSRAVDVEDTTKSAGELKVPSTLVVDGKKYTVTSIGANAFLSNTNITSVTMADTVTKLGYSCFSECSNLVTCQLSDNITDWGEADVSNESTGGSIFWNCSKLASVNIPNGVSVIPRSCFGNCSSLKSIEIPANNLVIGHQAFMGTGFTSISLPEGTTFSGSAEYSTALGGQFKNCTSLKTVTLPDSITFMPYCVFYGCTSLVGVSFSNSITEIGFGSFANCSSLTSFVVPDSCEKIHNVAFQQCTKLASFTMPIDCNVSDTSGGSNYYQFHKDTNLKNVTFTYGRTGKSIENNGTAFRRPHACGQTNGSVVVTLEEGITDISNGFLNGCTSIKSINIPESIVTMGSLAFADNTYAKDLYWNNTQASFYYGTFKAYGKQVDGTTLHIGDKVTSIPCALTASCPNTSVYDQYTYIKGFNYVDWGTSNVTELNGMQFYRCQLKEIDLSNIKVIGDYALARTNLTTVTIPESVKTIGGYALSWNDSLVDVYLNCYDAVMVNADRSIFHQCSPKIHVGDSYQEHGVDSIQTEVIGNNQLYCSYIHYIDWGNFKPKYIPQMNFSSLYEITIPDSVTEIASKTFYYSDDLKIVRLTKGTTKIYASAFSTTAVDTVYYDGTESERNAILTIEESGNSQLINATWIYLDEEVPEYKKFSWSYDSTSGTAICNGFSEYGKTLDITSLSIPSTFTNNGVEYTATGIGEYAFQNNTNITSVTFPDTMTSISNGAFENCTNLSSITLPSNLSSLGGWVFKNTGLTSVTLPDSLVSIGNECFRNSTKLSSVTFGTGLETIGDNAFNNTVITSVNASNTNLQSIGGYAFANNSKLTAVSLPDTAVFVGDAGRTTGGYQFYKCTALKELTIPSANTIIPGSLCDSCSSLTNVTIPDGVTDIGKYALCVTKLTTLDFPKSITHVYQGAFVGDSSLTTVYYDGTVAEKANITIDSDNSPLTNAKWICDGMKEIKYNGLNITCDMNNGTAVVASIADSSVTDIVIPDSVTVDGVECKIVAIDGTPFKGNTQITSVSVGENITAIKAESFRGCTSLKNVEIKGGTSIGDNTFRDCKAIESVSLPEGLETIGSGVFQDCQSMTTVNIPSTVTSIGSGAFWACHGLTEITIPEGITVIRSNTFDSCSKLEIVNLPLSLETVEKYAFYSTALNTVNYAGTADNKNGISIASYNSPLTNATWNCITASTLSLRPIEELEILEEDGIVIIDSELLAAFPDIRVLILPKTIKCIEENAFSNNTVLETVKYAGSPSMWDDIDIAEQGNENLFNAELIFLEEDEVADTTESEEVITEYSITDGVCSIDESLLSSYADLEILNIPVSVTEICANAFINNSVLNTVNYAGTEEQWNDISISSEGNDNLFNAEITFTEEESTDEELTTEEETIEEDVTEEELTEDESLAGDNDEEINSDEEESTETSPIEIETDTVPIESEEPSCDSDDFVTPVKEETTEEEVSSSDEENPESESSESSESTEETQSESSEEVTEEA